MKKKPLLIIVSICIVILIGVGAVWFATQQQPAKVEGFTFTGTIGEHLQIHMNLSFNFYKILPNVIT